MRPLNNETVDCLSLNENENDNLSQRFVRKNWRNKSIEIQNG